jgi:GntR family transcriptional repressor for pyruvate dehydrogenase complex
MESAAISTRALDLLLLLRGSEPEGLGRADQVSHQIETAILMGILTEGDRLPTESALASELGISPITLRQSLAALRTKGLIETSRGRSGGSVIRRQIELTDTELQHKLKETSTEALEGSWRPEGCRSFHVCPARRQSRRSSKRGTSRRPGEAPP